MLTQATRTTARNRFSFPYEVESVALLSRRRNAGSAWAIAMTAKNARLECPATSAISLRDERIWSLLPTRCSGRLWLKRAHVIIPSPLLLLSQEQSDFSLLQVKPTLNSLQFSIIFFPHLNGAFTLGQGLTINSRISPDEAAIIVADGICWGQDRCFRDRRTVVIDMLLYDRYVA